VKLLVDLIRDGNDKWEAFCAATGIVPKRIIFLDCSLKAFGNLMREENPEFKEEEFEEEDRSQKNQELERLRQLKEQYDRQKDTNS